MDVYEFGFQLTYYGIEGANSFNLGLLGFELSDLHFESGEVIVDVQEQSSSWPSGTFDDVSFGNRTISIDLSAPVIYIDEGDYFVANFVITTPEPMSAAGSAAALVALGVRASRRSCA